MQDLEEQIATQKAAEEMRKSLQDAPKTHEDGGDLCPRVKGKIDMFVNKCMITKMPSFDMLIA
jgi:hypothetical protein